MTLHATDLGLMALVVLVGCGLCYALMVWKLRQLVTSREMKIADQLGALDAAIRALETRLAEHRINASTETEALPATTAQEETPASGESITGEIKAVIAAAATAVLHKNAAIKSIRSVPAPWSQQGRVIVLGSHNLRVRQ